MLYLKKKNFTEALNYAKTDNQKDTVVTAQADYYFSQNRFILSATHYAQSKSLSFEEIVLKFVAKNEWDAIKVYLAKKLETIKSVDVTQTILLSTWLVEMYINKLNEVRDEVDRISARIKHLNIDAQDDGAEDSGVGAKRLLGGNLKSTKENLDEELRLIEDDFRSFLKLYKVKQGLHRSTGGRESRS